MTKPFASHIDHLVARFRTAIPQVGALLPYMPDVLLHSLVRELQLMQSATSAEVNKRAQSAALAEVKAEVNKRAQNESREPK